MSLSIPERKRYITNYFIGKGYTPVQASAIVGNLQQENRSFDPNIKNSIGATGIAQWLGKGRKGKLLQRENPYNIDTQLDFLHDELQGNIKGAWTNNVGGKEAFFNTDDVNKATYIIRKDFERPGEHEAHDKQRYKFAHDAMTLVDPNYKFIPESTSQQTNLPQQQKYNVERQDLSTQSYLSAIEGRLNTATEELAKFQEERAQEQQKQETLKQEDVQRQVLEQAQKQKEDIYNLLTQNPPEGLQYDVSPTQQAFSQAQPFQFQTDFYTGEGLFQEGGTLVKSPLTRIKHTTNENLNHRI